MEQDQVTDALSPERSKLYGGSRLSKFLGGLSCVSLLFFVVVLLTGQWLPALTLCGLAIASGIVSYKLAGGKENPQIYADYDLFGLIKYAVQTGNARIGFPKSRQQEKIIAQLNNAGVPASSDWNRETLRAVLVKDRRAFSACRGIMSIDCPRNGRDYFWDGFCSPKTSEWFVQAEIIVTFESRTEAIVDRFFTLMAEGARPVQRAD